MPNKKILRYFVTVRLSHKQNDRKNFHIDACTPLGAFYQTWKLLQAHGVQSIWGVSIRPDAFPIAKKLLVAEVKKQNRLNAHRIDNIKAIKGVQIYTANHTPQV